MSRTITLPSGATAVLRDADDVTFGDREDVLKMFDIIDPTTGGLRATGGDLLVAFERAVIVLAVESWTLADRRTGEPLPLPTVDPGVLRRLTVRDGAYLAKQAEELRDLLFPDFSVSPDPASPTSPSVVSATS